MTRSHYYLDEHFERNKNLKALGLTAAVCAAILACLLLIGWSVPHVQPPVVDEGIEVNLGNSDQGLGDIAPAIPGAPSNETASNDNPPPPAESATNTASETADESDAPDATPIASSPNKTPKNNNTATTTSANNKRDVANTPPAPPKPKAVYGGGATPGPGGNNADSYNGVRNQGIAGGKGDQGNPNGDPNSNSYTGTGGTGKSGVSIRNGLSGRRFTQLPSFEDDFNQPAKVAVDIKVDKNGNVTSAVVNPRGTTTTNNNVRSIALRKARQLKLNNSADEEQMGTIVFDFKIRG